jgi:hypothetical protein
MQNRASKKDSKVDILTHVKHEIRLRHIVWHFRYIYFSTLPIRAPFDTRYGLTLMLLRIEFDTGYTTTLILHFNLYTPYKNHSRSKMSFCRWKGRCEEIQFMVMVNVSAGGINGINEYDYFYLYLRRQATQKRKRLILADFIFLQWSFCMLPKPWSAHLLRWLNHITALSLVVPCDSSCIARSSLISAVSLGGHQFTSKQVHVYEFLRSCYRALEEVDLRGSRWWSHPSSHLTSSVLVRIVAVAFCFFCVSLHEIGLYWYDERGGAQYRRTVLLAPPIRVPSKHPATLFRCNRLKMPWDPP